MKRKPLYECPVLKKEEILDFLKSTKFIKMDPYKAFHSPFFNLLKERYNGVPVLSRYICKDVQKFKQCMPWFQLSAVEKLSYNDKIKYDHTFYKINPIIFSLLNNSSLKNIATIEGEEGFSALAPDYDSETKFESLVFQEISPVMFDGDIAEVAMDGSVYFKWKHAAFETKLMANEFVSSIIGNRYEDFRIYKTNDCWSGHIMGLFVAYFIFDEGKGEFWVFSKDDYD